MKDLFFRLCIGVFSVETFNFIYGFCCGLFGKVQDDYCRGFFGCLAWWIVMDGIKKIGWYKEEE